ncbi:endonuclease/exonuclease/phosphatase family protein [Sciscionella sediminilitoris]|uniref:endonuclease/exonuclease/phosphatase family protein n=1 Tax=Sciscionella sediminilitoris TaxID=1445613 RepID=UPI0004DF0070|nr:endonuclease/exonuclease/phosphatase family protein [Sciscionella sp. SE31]
MSRIAGVLAALVLLLAGTAVTAEAGTGSALRIMNFNIRAGTGMDGSFDLDRTAAAINAEHPDVVGLEEVDRHWDERSRFLDEPAELARRTGMHPYFAPIYSLDPKEPGAPRREFGVAVLSRSPILHARNRDITRLSTQDPSAKPAPAPGFAQVLLAPHGRPLWLYVTHLDFRPDPTVRQAQVADMRRIMRPAPGVLLGDFNADPDAPELRPLHIALRDAWRGPGGLTYPADEPKRRIDQVLIPPGFGRAGAHVPDTLAADHRPVVADLVR